MSMGKQMLEDRRDGWLRIWTGFCDFYDHVPENRKGGERQERNWSGTLLGSARKSIKSIQQVVVLWVIVKYGFEYAQRSAKACGIGSSVDGVESGLDSVSAGRPRKGGERQEKN